MRVGSRLIIALVLASASSLHAATFTWSGDAVLGTQWSRDNNWTTSSPPTNGSAALIFTGANRFAEADADWSILSLTFNSSAGAFVISGNTLTIGSGGVSNNDNSNQLIGNDIILSAAQTWDSTSSSDLAFTGAVNTNTRLLTLTPALASSTIVINGAISGTGGLTINGAGHVNFAGTGNTYTGTTTVNSGTLFLESDPGVNSIVGPLVIGDGTGAVQAEVIISSQNQIANTSDVTVKDGGIFEISASDTIHNLTINNGLVSMGSAKSLGVSSATFTGGSIGGSSTDILVLNGNVTTNAAADTAIINPGVDLSGLARTFTVGDGAATPDLTISGVISNGGIVKGGAGTLQMKGTSNTYSGTTTVNAGTLELNKNSGRTAIPGALIIGDGSGAGTLRLLVAEQIANTSSVTINRGVLDLNDLDETIAGLTMTGGTVNTGAGTLTLGGDVTSSVSGAIVPAINGNLNLGGTARTLTVNNAAAAPIDFNINAVIANGALIKDGAGTLLLGGSNSFSGGLTVNAGEVAFGSKTAAGAGTLTLNAGVIRADGAPQILANTITLGGNITIGGSLELVFSGPAFLTGDRTMTISNSGLTTFGAIGQDSSGRALTKTGAGTLVLSGANTYSGGTTLNQGKLISSGSLAISKGVLVADGAIFEAVNPQSLKVLNVDSGGLAILSSTTPTFLTTNSLLLTGSAALDMNQRAMAINYLPGQSPFAAVRASIISGYANGAWTGAGIRSSTAGANSRLAIGYAEASAILGPAGGMFLNQNVDGDTVLVRTTIGGDANLDGVVGFADLVKVAQNYDNNSGTATWTIGDFNYDGKVGFADLVKVAQNYDDSFLPAAPIPGASASFDRDVAAAFAEVPEPSSALVLVISVLGVGFSRVPRREHN